MPDVGTIAIAWTDLVRLLLLPAFAWAAGRDMRTRRVPNALWPPLAVIGAILLVVDAVSVWTTGGILWRQFAIGAGMSLGVVIPLAYLFWLLGGFGGADAKALMVLAVLFPVFPTYQIGSLLLPAVETSIGSLTLTILTNAVVVGLVYPLGLGVYNLLQGHISSVMFVGRPRDWDAVETSHGQLLETPEGVTRRGLDLDALRMYLRWRDTDLETLRAAPERMRDPDSLPEQSHAPTDGAITDGGRTTDSWGAAKFLNEIEGNAYGTDPETLRDGLDVLVAQERVWVSPGIPFLLPLFIGLVSALTYGDIVYGVMTAAGLVPAV